MWLCWMGWKNARKRHGKNLLALGLKPSKTKYIHFSNQNIAPCSSEIQVNGIKLQSIEKTWFLGLIFDYKFSVNFQIELVLKKCSKALNIAKFLSGTFWGSHPSTLLTFYKSYVQSIIEYGCFLYFPKQKKWLRNLKKYNTQQ